MLRRRLECWQPSAHSLLPSHPPCLHVRSDLLTFLSRSFRRGPEDSSRTRPAPIGARGWPQFQKSTVTNLATYNLHPKSSSQKIPTRISDRRRRTERRRRGAERSHCRPDLSRVLSLPRASRGARRARPDLRESGHRDPALPCECHCPAEKEPPEWSMGPEQEPAKSLLCNDFSSNDFYLFSFGVSRSHQGLDHPKMFSLFLVYNQISKRQRGTEIFSVKV